VLYLFCLPISILFKRKRFVNFCIFLILNSQDGPIYGFWQKHFPKIHKLKTSKNIQNRDVPDTQRPSFLQVFSHSTSRSFSLKSFNSSLEASYTWKLKNIHWKQKPNVSILCLMIVPKLHFLGNYAGKSSWFLSCHFLFQFPSCKNIVIAKKTKKEEKIAYSF